MSTILGTTDTLEEALTLRSDAWEHEDWDLDVWDPLEFLVEVPGSLDPVVRQALGTVAGAAQAGALVGRDPAQALAVIEAAEAVKAWVEHVGLEGWARLREAIHEDAETDPIMLQGMYSDGSGELSDVVRADLDSCVADEVALATGLGPMECHARFRFAMADPDRTATLRARMAAGRTVWWQARRVMEACQGMPAAVADEVAVRVLAPARDGSIASSGMVSRRLSRQVALHDPQSRERRRGEAFLRRDARATLEEDGSGTLVITTTAARAVQCAERLDAAARASRAAGDPRTVAQLRSDIATALLSAGILDSVEGPRGTETTSTETTSTEITGTEITGTGATGTGATGTGATSTEARDAGDTDAVSAWVPPDSTGPPRVPFLPPPARVNVVVALSTLLGLDEHVGEIPGHGFLTADHIRQVALAAGSIWRRLVVDDLSGHAIELSTQSYRPTEEMRAQVAARDGVCRGPGCTIPAASCDLDHQRPWPNGPTSMDNLNAKHRAHHNRKTRGLWRCEQDNVAGDEAPSEVSAEYVPPDVTERRGGALSWTTRARRRYTTYPAQYLHPDYDPVREPPAEPPRPVDDDPPPF